MPGTPPKARFARPAAIRRAGRWLVGGAVLALAGGCITGRVLEGYPGYPFLEFSVPASPDTTFFDLQDALEAEGFELDYSERASGLINTRTGVRDGVSLFLTAVTDTTATAGATRVWVAGYEPVRTGARRIDPLSEEAWATLRSIVLRLSDRLGGTEPTGPPPPDG